MATQTPALTSSYAGIRTSAPPIRMLGILLASDILALVLAVFTGFQCWLYLNPVIPSLDVYIWFLAIGFAVASMASKGLYPGIGLTAVAQLRRMAHSITLAYLLLATTIVLVKGWDHSSRGAIVLAWMFSFVFVLCNRWISGQLLSVRGWWGSPSIILGAGETARKVIRNLNANQSMGYRPVACLDDDIDKHGYCEGIPVAGSLRDAAYFANLHNARYAIVAMPTMPREQLLLHLRAWSAIFPNIVIVPDLQGLASLWTEPRDLAGVLGLEIQHKLLHPSNRWIKRGMDIIVSAIGLVLAAPCLAVVAIWIKRCSPGPVLYEQEREGKNGRMIRILKLRSMYVNAEQMLLDHLAEHPDAREEWGRFCKLKHDPRILAGVGAFIRKTSLDEVPQLWNVFRGDMSLVGPRPFPVYHNQQFTPEFRTLRTQVTPGLTGLWQVSARSDGDFTVQESFDSYYIRNWSLWLDIYILIRTARTVLAQDGAY